MSKRKKRKKGKVIKLQPKLSLTKYIKLKARNLEIHEVYIGERLFENGKGHVIFTRKKRNGQKLVGVYLIDTWCLGVKDTFYLLLEDYEYLEFIAKFYSDQGYSIIKCDPNHACNVIYGAIEYAEDLGIDPHKDFSITEFILEDVEKIEYKELEFGFNGIPYFMAYDTDNRAAILSKLNKSVGKDGYIYTDGNPYLDKEVVSIYDEAADKLIVNPENKRIYLSYVSVLKFLEEMCMHDYEKYKEIYLHNRNEFIKIAIEKSIRQFDLNTINNNANFEENVLAVAENYFIYGGTDFILQKEFVLAFAFVNAENILGFFHNMVLMNYGQKKLDLLGKFISNSLEDTTGNYYDGEDIGNIYRSRKNDPEEIKDNVLVELLFFFLEGYEGLYGEIDFKKINININLV